MLINFKYLKSGICLLCFLPFLLLCSCHKESVIVQGERISQSVTIQKDIYYFIGSNDSIPVLEIEGNDIVVDFNGSTIIGDTNYYAQDLFAGYGIKVRNGHNITIKNLTIRGFKVGLYAENIPGLIIENCDFSYNYRPKLKSRREREDLSDWLSYHDNNNDEWLRFGSGIYLKNCDHATISNNHITQNQNALLMVDCDSSVVYNNRFVFNSGLGIGLYRSTYNSFMHNCLDFNVRGYSHGFYRRGQDSAGALFYEQSSNNTFAYNSATHSGDGFFLWAGNSTMDSGKGGCNNNLIAYNDFSYAPTNGIEVTFSSNIIIGNKMIDCRYGIWGGYSYDTYISDNIFEKNNYGIAIEHGNNNIIVHNDFNKDEIGIQLWEREDQPSDWGFAERRDVSSRNYQIGSNTFTDVDKIYDIRNTNALDTNYHLQKDFIIPVRLHDGLDAESIYNLEGRDKMMVNEWGPYNFEYPQIWLTDISTDTFSFQVLGPEGRWHLKTKVGLTSISRDSGTMGETIIAVRNPERDLIDLHLVYNGPDFTDQQGVIQKGKDHNFSFSRYDKAIEWNVKWYTYDDTNHPLGNYPSFKGLKNQRPEYEERTIDLAYTWWRSPGANVHPDKFGTFASGKANFSPGEYLVQITSDDGLRFYVDGDMVIDNWNIHVPVTDSIKLELGGDHQLEIEHFEGGGFSTLDFRIEPIINKNRDLQDMN